MEQYHCEQALLLMDKLTIIQHAPSYNSAHYPFHHNNNNNTNINNYAMDEEEEDKEQNPTTTNTH